MTVFKEHSHCSSHLPHLLAPPVPLRLLGFVSAISASAVSFEALQQNELFL